MTMKSVTFESKLNRDRFECDNVRDVEVIDGVEYLKVRRPNTARQFLFRKDTLEKVKPKEVAR
jgi:hypothetical protein